MDVVVVGTVAVVSADVVVVVALVVSTVLAVVDVLVIVEVVVAVVVGALVVGSVVVGGGASARAAAAIPIPKRSTIPSVAISFFGTTRRDYRCFRCGSAAPPLTSVVPRIKRLRETCRWRTCRSLVSPRRPTNPIHA